MRFFVVNADSQGGLVNKLNELSSDYTVVNVSYTVYEKSGALNYSALVGVDD